MCDQTNDSLGHTTDYRKRLWSVIGLFNAHLYPVYAIKQTSSQLVEPASSCKRGIILLPTVV